MAAFSVHQVRQLYVANAYKENLKALKDAGDITVVKRMQMILSISSIRVPFLII